MEIERKTSNEYETTGDGSLDRKGNPAIKKATGGWTSAILLLGDYKKTTFTEQCEQVDWDRYLFSLAGAFLSDSYWGRYLTCAIFQLVYVAGLVLLSLTSWLYLIKPSGCGDGARACAPVTSAGTALFYVSIYLIALGNGGYQPSIATFGADQFDESEPSEGHSKVAFFSYFYLALNSGSLFSNTFLVYLENSGSWSIGFWTSAGSAALALALFLAGTPWFRHFRPSGNPLVRIAQVVVAAARKWDIRVRANGEEGLYEVDGTGSAIAGTRKIFHSEDFRFLDKAATITDTDSSTMATSIINPWRLCTVTQVEEVKCVLKMLPIWLCTIIYSVVFTQMASLFVEQGAKMRTTLSPSFDIPPASMSAFDILSVLFFIFLYRRFLVPLMRRVTGNPKGLSELQRMGVGLVIGALAMVAAGLVELQRLKRARARTDALSIFWQVPQYALIGASEVFMYVGQLEFFNGQAPDGIKSFGSSLCMASMSLGNYASSGLVSIVMAVATRGGRAGWIPADLDQGHMDRFFFLLAGLTFVDLVVYVVCARWYKAIELGSHDSSHGSSRVGLLEEA
ncbi:Nitrate transporter 1.5 [Acorus calamus]|uniref:Nitrate transporter 1.5 n=1 Tax=Acorus calamus TaxID=4465 RepID=A0AAV9CJW2_ACOCL|nr:Nitrate transporter 1.5 [Acorus calamus]